MNAWPADLAVTIAIGNPRIKMSVTEKITNTKVSFPALIHPTVIIGDRNSIEIGEGCIICASVIITTNVKIGDFVILNLACTVGHDCIIGNYASFMPSVNISGEVVVGDGVYVGTGAKIINQLEIGENTVIGAGAVVTASFPADCTAVGVPAKVIKIH